MHASTHTLTDYCARPTPPVSPAEPKKGGKQSAGMVGARQTHHETYNRLAAYTHNSTPTTTQVMRRCLSFGLSLIATVVLVL